MRICHWHKLLLVAALVFGQSLAIAHDYQHPATGSDTACQVCVHGQSFQAGPAIPATLDALRLSDESPQAALPAAPLTCHHRQASIRAPPTRLA